MMRTVYVNGAFVPENEAQISVFDRGFLFADAVYEVTTVLDGKLIDFPGHMARLHRSLGELEIRHPATDEELLAIHRKLIEVNDLTEGLIYLQVSRGAADRDFLFPGESVEPTLVLFTQKKAVLDNPVIHKGLKVVSMEDLRWRRCDIKTVQLLFASLIKTEAKKKGADDVWMTRDGFVTEGSSNNAYIVTEDGRIVTRDLSNDILSGITRKAVLECAKQLQFTVEERPFTIEEAQSASEAFATSATGFVNPVVEIDGVVIGTGKPGPVGERLRQLYIEIARVNAL